jgi:hypothetical protein
MDYQDLRTALQNHFRVKCSPNLGQRELEFSGVKAQVGGGADEPFVVHKAPLRLSST